jgi:integrase
MVLKGRTWWFHRDIPAKLRPAFDGRKTLTKSLATGDIRVAQQRRDVAFAESEEWFRKARAGELNTLRDEALAWATGERSGGPEVLSERAAQVSAEKGKEEAFRFLESAVGHLPLDAHLDAHLREARLPYRTEKERRTAVRRVIEWRPRMRLTFLGRKLAGNYVSDVLARGHPTTGNKAISNLSAYWAWMVRRGLVDENPWEKQRLQKPRNGASVKERPFTDEEITTLLIAPYPEGMQYRDRLHDTMRIAALSGMRIEEIAQLTAADCAGGVFEIHKAKTPAGIRKVPIHPDLLPIVERRSAGKKPTAFLIEDLEKEGEGERSMPLSKQFTRYRRKVGVDDTREGVRRSRANFHSFRRWFATKAEQAGQHPHIIEAVLGHRRLGMTLGVYSGGPSVEEQMRAVVEAVKLPSLGVLS